MGENGTALDLAQAQIAATDSDIDVACKLALQLKAIPADAVKQLEAKGKEIALLRISNREAAIRLVKTSGISAVYFQRAQKAEARVKELESRFEVLSNVTCPKCRNQVSLLRTVIKISDEAKD